MSTWKDRFEDVPPELILLISPPLSIPSLNAFALTCRRLHEILQPDLERRITSKLASEILLWAAASRPRLVAKVLSPPHSTSPNPVRGSWTTPLHLAVDAGNVESTRLLLEAGSSPAAKWGPEEYQPLHITVEQKDLAIMKLLLDYGAPINSKFGCGACSQNVLHRACSMVRLNVIQILLDRGADLECCGHYGTALGFAMHQRNLHVVKLLLAKGADATVDVPLFIPVNGTRPPPPHVGDLLYLAMGLRHPIASRSSGRYKMPPPPRWVGLPMPGAKKELMALMLAHGASKDTTMNTISTHLVALAQVAQYTEREYLEVIDGMLKEAEDAIPDVLQRLKETVC
ncbi:ankyrin repeat-containing domain protein [Mycena vitilis]|nr:ankyrin repeat-containing domain protein [Mycena vitilis]